jgi:hypothetical protein
MCSRSRVVAACAETRSLLVTEGVTEARLSKTHGSCEIAYRCRLVAAPPKTIDCRLQGGFSSNSLGLPIRVPLRCASGVGRGHFQVDIL